MVDRCLLKSRPVSLIMLTWLLQDRFIYITESSVLIFSGSSLCISLLLQDCTWAHPQSSVHKINDTHSNKLSWGGAIYTSGLVFSQQTIKRDITGSHPTFKLNALHITSL